MLPDRYAGRRLGNCVILVRDLREGKYMGLNPKRFAGNIFTDGERFYEVQNSGAWKRVEKPEPEKVEKVFDFS